MSTNETIVDISDNLMSTNETIVDISDNFTKFFEICAWIGSIMILLDFIVEFKPLYALLINAIGPIPIVLVCIKKRAFQPMFLNICWIIGGIIKFFIIF